jgi:hypothetical protein
MNTKITRSAGITTGYGYLVGNGYEGKTKELDDKVIEIATQLKDLFGKNIEIRFNSNRESGGGFVKDNNGDCTIGIGASLMSSKFQAMSLREQIDLSAEEFNNLPNDIILYHVVLDESIAKTKIDVYDFFNTIQEAFQFLNYNIEPMKLKEYLEKF